MKEISTYPLKEIQSVIFGENYVNLKARLDQLCPEFSSLFASFKIDGDEGIWYGKDNIAYQRFQDASETQKEEIAAQLEIAKQSLCDNPPEKMENFVNLLFQIPSESQIFWYLDNDGNVSVTLAQWGFSDRDDEKCEDVIQVLIDKERPLTQVPVTLKFIYSNLEPASNYDFQFHLFNNEKLCKTDVNGEYHVGTLFAGKKIAVSTIDGKQYQEFFIEKGKEFITTINLNVIYSITIKNQYGDLKPYYPLEIGTFSVKTDENGVYRGEAIIEPEAQINVTISDNKVFNFKLSKDSSNNDFIIEIQEDVKKNPDTFCIRLLDYDGKPLIQMPFKILSTSNIVIDGITDINGYAKLSSKYFKDKEKYQIFFEDSEEYRKSLKK